MKRVKHFVERFVGGAPIVKCGAKGLSVERVVAGAPNVTCKRCRMLLGLHNSKRKPPKRAERPAVADGPKVTMPVQEFGRLSHGPMTGRALGRKFDELQMPTGLSVKALLQGQQSTHPDELAVDEFAAAMKARLAAKRAEGQGGWDKPYDALRRTGCSIERLKQLLRIYGSKENPSPVDVANFAMMVYIRTKRGA